jgi:RNA polymerase sigma-70 factor, ECF subfamily
MTSPAVEIHREARLVAAARAGDEQAFSALTEPHRRALHVHCYRLLGSLHEAEDLVQETMLRAWRRLETFEGRASFTAWLYGIATNACLDALRGRSRRVLPSAVVPPDDPTALPEPPRTDVSWLEPYPDELLPQAALERRETIRLAFVAAIQHLPPRQRAVLLLRDVLGWSAPEISALLGSSVASVNSALQRARSAVEDVPARENVVPDVEAALADRYLAAFEAADVARLAALLKEDVVLAMPPTPSWYRGRPAVTAFFTTLFARYEPGALRLVPTSTHANGAPAFGVYARGRALAVKVLDLDRGGIAAITGFADSSLFARFDLSETLG